MRGIVKSGALPVEDVQKIREEVLPEFQRALKGRLLLPVWDVGEKTEEVGYDRFKSTDMRDAEIVAPGGNFPVGTPKEIERLLEKIRKLGLGWNLPREKYLHDEYVTRAMKETARKVAELEDGIIFDGVGALGIYGLLDVAYSTVSGSDWTDHSTTGGTPYGDLVSAIGEMRSNSNNQFGQQEDLKNIKVIMHPDMETELMTPHLAEVPNGDIITRERFLDLIGGIVTTTEQTSSEVDLMHTGESIAQLAMAEDFTTENPKYDIDHQTYRGNFFVRDVPVVYQWGDTDNKSTAFVKLDSLES